MSRDRNYYLLFLTICSIFSCMIKQVCNKKMAIDILKVRGLKATPQRIELINEISILEHAVIEVIYGRMKNKFPTISAATIYKIIDILLHQNILDEIHISVGKNRYELKKKPHSHHICTICGKISDLYLNFEPLLRQIKNENYNPVRCEIYFYGICPDCRKWPFDKILPLFNIQP